MKKALPCLAIILALSPLCEIASAQTTFQKIFNYHYQPEPIVQQTTDNGYVITNNFDLIKTTSDGKVEWSKNYIEHEKWYSQSTCVKQTKDGGFIMGGCTKKYGAGDCDF